MKPVKVNLKRKTMVKLANHAIAMFNEMNYPEGLSPDDTRAVLTALSSVLGRVTQVVVQNADLLNSRNRNADEVKAGQQQMIGKLTTELQKMGVTVTDEESEKGKDMTPQKDVPVYDDNGQARDWSEIAADRIFKKFGKKVR